MMSDVSEYQDLPALSAMTVLDNPIVYWLKRDLWTKNQAALLLSYLDPRNYLDGKYDKYGVSEMEDLIECSVAIETLKVDHSNFENSIAFIPLNIVKWAINKELDVPKLLIDWYEEETTKQPTRSASSALCEYLNSSHPMYSEELAAAIETWESVLQCNPPRPKTNSRKLLIENHLKQNYSDFNQSQQDRIALMLNPDFKGGAPTST